MKHKIIQSLVAFYCLLLRLYPRHYREEFGEEMTAVFQQTLTNAPNYWHILAASLRELRDWPINCWREHWHERRRSLAMYTIEPVVWINDHKRMWRTAVLGLLLLGFLGPWTYESTYLPIGATCSGILLESNNCGLASPGILILMFWLLSPGSIVHWLIGGSQFYLLIILTLNIVLTLLSLSRIKRISRVLLLSWGIAVVAGLYLTLSSVSRIHPALWGVWLSLGLAVIMLILEIFVWLGQLKDKAYVLD